MRSVNSVSEARFAKDGHHDAWKSVVLVWSSAHQTDIGSVRQVNEDSILHRPYQGLWVVADGMGGHSAGDYASQLVTKTFEQLEVRGRPYADVVDEVDQNLQRINHELIHYAHHRQLSAVGSTFVSLILTERLGICMWMGDSRLYRVRNGTAVRITRDHSLVQSLVDHGELDAEDTNYHPSRHVVTRALGVSPYVYADIRIFEPQDGDTYVLCSDGFYQMVHESVMGEVIRLCHPNEAVEVLMESALADQADDNVSLVVVKVMECPDLAMTSSPPKPALAGRS